MIKKSLVLMLSLLILGIVAACTPDNGASEELQEVDIGYFPNLDHAAGIVGNEQGIMQDALGDIEASYTSFPDGNQFIESLDHGEIDIGYVGPGPAINYYLNGGDAVILAAGANGATLLVSSEESGIENLEDFPNKSFGSPGNGCTHNVQLEKMLQDKGMTSERVGGEVKHNPHIAPANSAQMFEQGQLDAYTAPEPWGTYMVEEMNANVIKEWDEVFLGETLPSVVLLTSENFLEEHPEVVKQVVEGHQDSVEFAQDNPNETTSLINDNIYELSQQELPEDVLQLAWDRFEVTSSIHGEALKDWATASYELDFLNDEPDLDGLVDTSILEKIK